MMCSTDLNPPSARRQNKQPTEVKDQHGDSIVLDDWLLPQMTIADGRIVYRQIDFQ